MTQTLRMGTRGSALALAQSGQLAREISARTGVSIETVEITTQGDAVQDRQLVEIGGKGLFVKAIETALLNGEVDFAVHSLKDMPFRVAEGLTLIAIPPRADPRDVLIGSDRNPARIGTGSPRRVLQLRDLFPTSAFVPLRGNIDTRIGRVGHSDPARALDAVILAAAGLGRLGAQTQQPIRPLSVQECIPCAGQAFLAIEARVDSPHLELLRCVDDARAHALADLERLVLAHFEADCTLPVGVFAEPRDTGAVIHVGLFAQQLPGMRRKIELPQLSDHNRLQRELDQMLTDGGRVLLDQNRAGQA